MSKDYSACVKQLLESKNEVTAKRSAWMERILFLCATLFGILVSLHSSTPASLHTRLCFCAACILLALGILLLGIASYQHIAAQARANSLYSEEIQNAMTQDRDVQIVQGDKPRIYSICENCAYICLLLSIVALAVYVSLLTFIGV